MSPLRRSMRTQFVQRGEVWDVFSQTSFLAQSFDAPSIADGADWQLASAELEIVRIPMPRTALVTNVLYMVTTAGGTLTSAKNFVGLYAGSTDNGTLGTRLGISADQSTPMATTGLKTAALTGTVTINGGPTSWIYGAILCTGTTPIKTLAYNGLINAVVTNIGQAGPPYRAAFAATQTTIPSTMPTLSAGGRAYWMALS